mgnify:CR=1 FL=1
MTLLNDFLLQIFLALLPFVMFNVYYRDKPRNYSRRFITITCMISLFLSMTFAFSVKSGIMFDVRYIIMYFGLIFGGLQTGFILLAEFLIYRIYLGGEGRIIAMIIISITFPLSVIFYLIYKATRRITLVTVIACITLSIVPFVCMYLYSERYMTDYLIYNILAILIQNLCIWLLVTLFNKSVSDKELYINYIEQEKFHTISHIAASLAHEVRNPLTTVKGFLQLIREQLPHDKKLTGYIDISMDEVQRTESILSEYLSISKPLIQHHEQVNLAEEIQIVINMMTPYANMNKVILESLVSNDPIYIKGNSSEIKQVLINFVKNAVEACEQAASGKVIIITRVESRVVVIRIKDYGIGMDKEQLKRLGSIYFTTKSKGTGLGLTFSYQVIRALGGNVIADSEPSIGTTFTISLPLYAK